MPRLLPKKIIDFWKKLGPGIVTGTSDDDPSGIVTYSQAGARFGFDLLWTALLTYPLMFAVQEMCARIGIVSMTGISGVIKKHYPKYLVYLVSFVITPAIIFNIAADIAGMSAVMNLLIPNVPNFLFEIFIASSIVLSLIFLSYNRIYKIMKYFCLTLICYCIVPFLIHQDWPNVLLNTFFPNVHYNKEYLSLLVAVLGTTISPYLFFWQASMSFEHKQHNHQTSQHEIQNMKIDVNTGMFASNLAMYFIILTTGSVLHHGGLNRIESVEQAAQALKPLAGSLAYVLFSIGVLGVGFLTIPILAACVGYMFAETFNWNKGLDRKAKEAPHFYIVISFTLLSGLAINASGIDPINSLIFTAIIYGLITPFLLILILHISNNREIMGKYVNTTFTNVLGIASLFLMSAAAIALITTLF